VPNKNIPNILAIFMVGIDSMVIHNLQAWRMCGSNALRPILDKD